MENKNIETLEISTNNSDSTYTISNQSIKPLPPLKENLSKIISHAENIISKQLKLIKSFNELPDQIDYININENGEIIKFKLTDSQKAIYNSLTELYQNKITPYREVSEYIYELNRNIIYLSKIKSSGRNKEYAEYTDLSSGNIYYIPSSEVSVLFDNKFTDDLLEIQAELIENQNKLHKSIDKLGAFINKNHNENTAPSESKTIENNNINFYFSNFFKSVNTPKEDLTYQYAKLEPSKNLNDVILINYINQQKSARVDDASSTENNHILFDKLLTLPIQTER